PVTTEDLRVAGRVFFFQAEDGIRDFHVTGVQTCALPILCCSAMSSMLHQAAATTKGDEMAAAEGPVHQRSGSVDGGRRSPTACCAETDSFFAEWSAVDEPGALARLKWFRI